MKTLFGDRPIQSLLMAVFGAAGLAIAIAAGRQHWGGGNRVSLSLLLAILSGISWYAAAVFALIFENRLPILIAFPNVLAATFAVAAATYAVE